MIRYITPSGFGNVMGSRTQHSASLHVGLRVLRASGTGLDGIEREKAAMGFFVTLSEPTRPMKEEAVSAGFYNPEVWGTEYPKLQSSPSRD